MVIEPLVIAALVSLISAVLKAYAPQFPVSDELINSIVVALLGLFGVQGLKLLFPKATNALRNRGLLQ